MACLPETGRCERARTDAFVHHLNASEHRSLRHEACLDQIYRNSPQPEALYVQLDSGDGLVIERKTIAWPPDHIVRHQNDHLVRDTLATRIGALASDGAYAFILPPSISGDRGALAAFAEQIADTAARQFHRVRAGQPIGSIKPGRQWKLIRENPQDRAADGEPRMGLIIRWHPVETLDLTQDPPGELLAELDRIFSSCILKFRDYHMHRRILVLDPHGELRYLPDVWWHTLFHLQPPPEEVPEVWVGIHDWVTEHDQEWLFQRLYPPVADVLV